MTGAEKERGEEGGRSPSHPAGGSSLPSPRTLIPGGGESFLLRTELMQLVCWFAHERSVRRSCAK